MVLSEYKTSKHYDPIVETLPEGFLRILECSLERHPREFLFVNTKLDAFTPQGFSTWVRRTTEELFDGRAPGISLLRHAFCTALDYNKMTGLEMDEIAMRMGHSTARQQEYRVLDMKPIHEYRRGLSKTSVS